MLLYWSVPPNQLFSGTFISVMVPSPSCFCTGIKIWCHPWFLFLPYPTTNLSASAVKSNHKICPEINFLSPHLLWLTWSKPWYLLCGLLGNLPNDPTLSCPLILYSQPSTQSHSLKKQTESSYSFAYIPPAAPHLTQRKNLSSSHDPQEHIKA